MLLSAESSLRVVFTIYFAFWIVVVVGLYLIVGALIGYQERKAKGHGPH